MATIPEYIEVWTAAGQLAAVLSPEADGLKDCYIDTRLNAESTLSFLLPLTSEKRGTLTAECRIVAGGREFVVLRPDAVDMERDQQGNVWGKVMAAESWLLLNKQYSTIPGGATDLTVTILSSDPGEGGYPAGSAGSALYRLLSGSGWTLATCDVTGTHDLETEKLSLLENIEKVQEIWGGYLVWDSVAKTLGLRAESLWQNYTGFQVRYAKNLKNITRTVNYDLITRLYPFGENDLDISSVNGGIKYLDNHTFTNEHYVGLYQNQDIDDPAELKAKAEEILAKVCQPRYTYRVGLTDLRTLSGYSHEDFNTGDIVDVIDDDLGTDIQGRMMRHRYAVFRPWKCELEIGEPEERLAVKLVDSIDAANHVQMILRRNPTAQNVLKGLVNTLITIINSNNGKLVWNDASIEAIEIDGGGAPTGKRVRLSPAGIGISTDGGQTYSTVMTATGLFTTGSFVVASADGYTQLLSDGLKIFNDAEELECHLGEYEANKYGLWLKSGKIESSTGFVGVTAGGIQDAIDGFGHGSDGIFNSTGDVQWTVSVEDVSTIVKQYNSFTLNAGHTLSVDKRCRGVFIFVRGDVVINGTINLSGKAAKVSQASSIKRTLQIPVGTIALEIPSGGSGGGGGNGGKGSDTDNSGGTGGVGANGTPGVWFGGGMGSPGGGGGGGAGWNDNNANGGGGGNGGTINQDSAAGSGGIGGTGGNPGAGQPGATGGNFAGGGGGGGGSWTGSGGGGGGGGSFENGDNGVNGGVNGGAGGNGGHASWYTGALGGGLIVIVAKGNVTIGATGIINCNGINGCVGGNGGNGAETYGGGGGGGGGSGSGGGGNAVIGHRGTYTNNGSITVNAGLPGSGGVKGTTLYPGQEAQDGASGADGVVGSIIVTTV